MEIGAKGANSSSQLFFFANFFWIDHIKSDQSRSKDIALKDRQIVNKKNDRQIVIDRAKNFVADIIIYHLPMSIWEKQEWQNWVQDWKCALKENTKTVKIFKIILTVFEHKKHLFDMFNFPSVMPKNWQLQ